ncbi:MAG: Isoleucine-tRNA ligase [Candidatus Magasanikbacteria bacterium GW2011_GWC2_41_17]|uniref:Isoleucine--tRNA ligase n=2 Tax=Candidatus Magasanikiibacteriota TaxID=1752731 RepID=A0A0G0WIW0_9BACT|nr:MAG: Isoleucine-tRNA ligase [Candidatus Magasanikbacteria bacterium GW2011_GWC2_41_17]KKS12839.1 MAG: Isoleucine-tRNA ligase [Candidatus Magasanikbacteria bacterium GW2011_GWA2_41_55]
MYNANKEEQEILKYWEEHKCFEKSVESRPASKPYVFYDGPPFATGLPHYGHIVASLMKDVVPRYWTMRGFRVERKWGWDCHGLPIENIIEKELSLKSRKDIENFGVDKFNQACHSAVLRYAKEWKKTIRRIGRWVDMENDYKTMDKSYMESVWWVFKQLWNQSLIYKGHKSMHICPRCVTPLSNFEVTQNYKTIKDISVTVKFKVKDAKEKLGMDGDVYILAWTTTPWTLPGNVLLAVNKEIEYVEIEETARVTIKKIDSNHEYELPSDEKYIIAKKALVKEEQKLVPNNVLSQIYIYNGQNYRIVKTIKGADLVGLKYEPLFPYFADTPNAFRVMAADFVSTEEGTGVVHIAPAFGEDDYNLGKKEGLPLFQHVSMDGKFIPAVADFAGQEVKPIEDTSKTDVEIIKWLAKEKKLFSKEKIEHSYPHCWRCDTPLLNYATSSWFVKVPELKEQLLKNNQQIKWVPASIKEGRFGLWLEGARDWAVSRNRFWGAPLPIWENEDGEVICIGSVQELEDLTGEKVGDLHKHIIDKLIIKKENKIYHRVPEVLDCWFESGSMPYGQMHYPFENKEKFEAGFPAEFIAEGQDQTRGWFYTLHVLATALTSGKKPVISVKESQPAFKNVIVNGIVLAEDGKKMSKRLKNYPEPEIVLEKYGADAMRYYLTSSPVMEAENLNFSEIGVREAYNKIVNTLWNVVEFYKMYESANFFGVDSKNVLDKWILSKLHLLIKDITKGMDNYELVTASRPILDFIADLSQWYLRRSRDRFKGDDETDKQAALATLREVLMILSKLMAPFTPFIAEKIYLTFGGAKESVHLEDWPKAEEKLIDEKILTEMAVARKIVEMGLALRAENGVKVRQPLSRLQVGGGELSEELQQIVADELNIKKVEMNKKGTELKVELDVKITPELKKEGLAREIIRTINQKRKESGLTINDKVIVKYQTDDKLLREVFVEFNDEIKKSVLAKKLEEGNGEKMEIDWASAEIKIEKI